jgi:dihydrofolate reductase
MKLSIIVASSRNSVIGLDNQLPWHLPDDLQYFKSVTMGKPIIMGRKTFESIGRPLPGRTNIVLTRDQNWSADGVMAAADLDAALALAKTACAESGVDETMIIGGEQIYRMTMAVAHRLYVTQVDAHVEGDAYFPEVDPTIWQKVEVKMPKVAAQYPYRFVIFDRY